MKRKRSIDQRLNRACPPGSAYTWRERYPRKIKKRLKQRLIARYTEGWPKQWINRVTVTWTIGQGRTVAMRKTNR